MAGAELKGFERILRSWETLLDRFKTEKEKALERMGKQALQDVKQNIGGSGKVSGWQEPHMGSGGGYVAVRAKARTYQTTKNGKRYAVGYITNSIEGGHRTGGQRPGPKADGYRYRPRYKKAAVPGRWFYEQARQDAERILQGEEEKLEKTIVDGLEGRL